MFIKQLGLTISKNIGYQKRNLCLIFFIILLNSSFNAKPQIICDSLKRSIRTAEGTDLVDVYNQISKEYEHTAPDSSMYYALKAESLSSELDYIKGLGMASLNKADYYVVIGEYNKSFIEYDLAIRYLNQANDMDNLMWAYNNKGNGYRLSGNLDEALLNFIQTLKISEDIGNKKGTAYSSLNVGLIYCLQNEDDTIEGLPYFLNALEICKEIGDQKCVAYSLNNIAHIYLNNNQYEKALSCHLQSLELKKKDGNKLGMASSMGNISDLYYIMEKLDTAISWYKETLLLYNEINNRDGIVHTLMELSKVYSKSGRIDEANKSFKEVLMKSKDISSLRILSQLYFYLYEHNEAQGKHKEALDYYKQYTVFEDSIYNENSSKHLAKLKTQFETEKKESEIKQLNNEKIIQDLKLKKAENQKWHFLGSTILALLLTIFIIYSYLQKRKANLFLEERNKLEIENKKKAINLFGQQVSKEVALELLSDSFSSDSKKLFACIMFLDIRNFTPFVESMEPSKVIQYQNDVFGFMIDIISKHHGVINQFLGDGFMATFGAPASTGNDCQNAVNAALEIVSTLSHKCSANELPETKLGIGLNAGNIVAGNVGTSERKQYSITGNAVILASRIEQLNKKFSSNILISKNVFDKLETKIEFKNLGHHNLKGQTDSTEIIEIIR